MSRTLIGLAGPGAARAAGGWKSGPDGSASQRSGTPTALLVYAGPTNRYDPSVEGRLSYREWAFGVLGGPV